MCHTDKEHDQNRSISPPFNYTYKKLSKKLVVKQKKSTISNASERVLCGLVQMSQFSESQDCE